MRASRRSGSCPTGASSACSPRRSGDGGTSSRLPPPRATREILKSRKVALVRCLAFLFSLVALGAVAEPVADYGQEKARIFVLREREPKRYAAELDALLARYGAQLSPGTAEREYLELGTFARFRLGEPDRAIIAFQAARRAQRDRALD